MMPARRTAIPVGHAGALAQAIAHRAAAEAPAEGLARPALCPQAGGAPLTRFAAPRIAAFETWLSAALGGNTPAPTAVHDLIGLGPGLTPSGDDLLIGALALLRAYGETDAQAALAQAILDTPPTLTSPLSGSYLRAAAGGHVIEPLCVAATSTVAGNADEPIAALRGLGHSSGWDMLAGIAVALRAVAAAR